MEMDDRLPGGWKEMEEWLGDGRRLMVGCDLVDGWRWMISQGRLDGLRWMSEWLTVAWWMDRDG